MFNIHLLNIGSVLTPYADHPYCRALPQGSFLEAQHLHRPAEHYCRASVELPLTGGYLHMHRQRDMEPALSRPEQTSERTTEGPRPLSLPLYSKIRHTNPTNSKGEMYFPSIDSCINSIISKPCHAVKELSMLFSE